MTPRDPIDDATALSARARPGAESGGEPHAPDDATEPSSGRRSPAAPAPSRDPDHDTLVSSRRLRDAGALDSTVISPRAATAAPPILGPRRTSAPGAPPAPATSPVPGGALTRPAVVPDPAALRIARAPRPVPAAAASRAVSPPPAALAPGSAPPDTARLRAAGRRARRRRLAIVIAASALVLAGAASALVLLLTSTAP